MVWMCLDIPSPVLFPPSRSWFPWAKSVLRPLRLGLGGSLSGSWRWQGHRWSGPLTDGQGSKAGVAMENGENGSFEYRWFIDLPGKDGGFPYVAMLNYQRVRGIIPNMLCLCSGECVWYFFPIELQVWKATKLLMECCGWKGHLWF